MNADPDRLFEVTVLITLILLIIGIILLERR
jgi:hypothetical protein